MQALLLERSLGKVHDRQFEQLTTEAFYFSLAALDRPKFPLKKTVTSINSLDFEQSENKYLLSGGSDSSIKIWNVGSKRARALGDVNKTNGGHSFGVTCVRWWPYDNGMFLSSSYDATIKVWDTNSFEEAHNFELDSKVNCFDISCTSGTDSLVATGTESSHVRILDLRTTSAVHSLSGHNGTITSCKWSPVDPNILATGSSEGEARIWDIRKTDSCVTQLDLYRTNKSKPIDYGNQSKKVGVLKTTVKAHSHGVNGLCWMENGKTLLSTGLDDKIRVWGLDDEGGINTLLNFGPFVKNRYMSSKSLLLSPSSETELQYIWYPSDNGEVLVFRIQDGKLVSRLRRNLQENSRSCCICYAGHNTATYFSGTVDGKINVWGPRDDPIVDELEDEDNLL